MWLIIAILICIVLYLIVLSCGNAKQLREEQERLKKNKEGGDRDVW